MDPPSQSPEVAAGDPPVEDWASTFESERAESGLFAGISGPLQPSVVLAELRRSRAAEAAAREEAHALRSRLAAATAEAAARIRDELLLRKELHVARAVGEANVFHLRQVLLEPAVNREFGRVTAAMEAALREAEALKEDMRALHFVANDPKGPRALAAQIRQLEEKCEALENAASESTVAALQRSLTSARAQLEEMRHQYGELEDHAHSLDDEIEILQRELLALRRVARNASETQFSGRGGAHLPPFGMEPPMPMDDRRGPPHPGPGGGPPPLGWGRGYGSPPPMAMGRGGPPIGFRGRGPPSGFPSMMGKRPRDH